MCPPIIGVVLAVVGAAAQFAMTSQIAKQQAKIEQQQLRTEIANEEIRAMSVTNDRLEQLRREEASNRAAVAATGLAQNISYESAIAPYNTKVATRDVEREYFNSGQVIGRKKYEIKVAGWRAKATTASAGVTAVSDSIGEVGSLFNS